MPTLIRPMSRPSKLFHAHCFQLLWLASVPFLPASPFWPRDPVEPIIPLSPFAPSRPSRPGNPLCPLRPGTPGRPGDPCRHVLVFCVIKEVSIVYDETMQWQFGKKDQRFLKSCSNSSGGFDNYDFHQWEGRAEGRNASQDSKTLPALFPVANLSQYSSIKICSNWTWLASDCFWHRKE